jgi:hypothetical protein
MKMIAIDITLLNKCSLNTHIEAEMIMNILQTLIFQCINKQEGYNTQYGYNNQNDEEEEKFAYSTSPSVFTSKIGRDDNFKVIIRVRPPLPREQHDNVPFRS